MMLSQFFKYGRSVLLLSCGLSLIVLSIQSPSVLHSIESLVSRAWGEEMDFYQGRWKKFQSKLQDLEQLQMTNQRLKLENAQLKLEKASESFKCFQQKSEQWTQKTKIVLTRLTGTPLGKTLESLTYHPPQGLRLMQVEALGVHAFEAHEYEKAAALLTPLLAMKSPHLYRTARNFLMTGVSWYHLGNLILANSYFDEILKNHKESSDFFLVQARLWKALVAQQLHQKIKSQYWLKELVDQHPHAQETAWIQGKGASVATQAQSTTVDR